MKRYEKESLLKNFLVFFSLLELLLVLLFLQFYQMQKKDYKLDILKNMEVCSYTLTCDEYGFDFSDKSEVVIGQLYDDNGLHAYFDIPNSTKFNIKISYDFKSVEEDLMKIQKELVIEFIVITILLLLIALFFTFYTLRPIRKALQLNDEFVKDILHDFNTPISSMVLNIKMFNDGHKGNEFIKRISHSIDNILRLENNLKSFLYETNSSDSLVDIASLVDERVNSIKNSYPKLTFSFEKHNELKKVTNKEDLIRIFDNLINNACKYNKPNGTVKVSIVGTKLSIIDTGKGIRNVKRLGDRYYKEQDRGLGLGLNIVKKLTSKLGIEVYIDTQKDIGTNITLDFKNLNEDLV